MHYEALVTKSKNLIDERQVSKGQASSGNLPSLKDGHTPEWVIDREPHLVRMREIGTGRSYVIPTERFNKAARFPQTAMRE